MFTFTRRTSTLLLVAAASLGSGLTAASPAQASAAGPSTTLQAAATVEPTALLLPAVQSAREAAARMSCKR